MFSGVIHHTDVDPIYAHIADLRFQDGETVTIYRRPFERIAHEEPVLGVRDGVRMVGGLFAHLNGRTV